MKWFQIAAVSLSLWGVACVGPEGPQGAQGDPGAAGEQGLPGPQGDAGLPGPLAAPPAIQSVSPDWGSVRSLVRIAATQLGEDPTAAIVTFDGARAEVVSATDAELWVRPTGGRVGLAAVSVQVDRQVSNAVAFEVVPSGTSRPRETLLPSFPSAAVERDGAIYIASANPRAASAGLYQRMEDGTTFRVYAPPPSPGLTDLEGQPIRDAPTALSVDAQGVWFTTVLGAVLRYDPQTGEVTQVLGPKQQLPVVTSGTGIARTAAGTLLVVERSGDDLIRVLASGEAGAIAGVSGAFAVAVQGSDAFVTRDGFNDVVRISAVDGAYTVTTGFATGVTGPQGIAVAGDLLIVSDASGALLSVDRQSGGALVPYVPASDLLYPATGLSVTATGALLAAQPAGNAVRRVVVTQTGTQVSFAAFGVLPAFGMVRQGASLYLAMVGPAMFETGTPVLGGPDSAVVELRDDGSSRVLAAGGLFAGLAEIDTTGGKRLLVSDCSARKIDLLDPATGQRTTLVAAADGLTCPVGLWVRSSGEFLYVDSGVFSGAPARIGRFKEDVTTGDFVEGLPANVLSVVEAGDRLLCGGVGPSGGSGLYWAPASGGTAQPLLPPYALGGPSAMVRSPEGRIYATQVDGWIYTLDPEGPVVTPFARPALAPAGSGGGVPVLAIGLDDSGALLVTDFHAQQLVAVAP